ncbi:Oidioi.mRNA.OKI2018_I69.chr1.g1162.t1.cds [Oikopleura dioica]|uniref:Oidioi.mRNA.OKI2018_I69.chr1.g1162.t1.cds n=1 Tax=Oikopleura dioica TaxID=34765 RepID=A0ABN7SM34_OIKDI|nr:Oidioi.mRNA.OKI2018_I69.chr1.g1162.t1.cds [Oikopleura dioica]
MKLIAGLIPLLTASDKEFIKCYECFHQLFESGMEVGSADCLNPDENTKVSEKLRYKTHTSQSTGKVYTLRTDCQAVKGTGYEEVILPNGEPGWNHFTFVERGHFEYLQGAPGYDYEGKVDGALHTLELHSCGSDVDECSKMVTFPIQEPESFDFAAPPTPSDPHGQPCYKCEGWSHFEEDSQQWVPSEDFRFCEAATNMQNNITDCWGTCEVSRQSFAYKGQEMSREVHRFCNNGTEGSNTQKNTHLNEFHHQKADASIMCQYDLCNEDFLPGGFSVTQISATLLVVMIGLFYN